MENRNGDSMETTSPLKPRFLRLLSAKTWIVVILAIILSGGGFLLYRNLLFIRTAKLDEREIAILGDLLDQGHHRHDFPLSPDSRGNFFVQGASAMAAYKEGSGYPLGHLPNELQGRLRTNYPGVTSPGWVWRYFRSSEYTLTFETWDDDNHVTIHAFNAEGGFFVDYARIDGSWQCVKEMRDRRCF